MKRTVFALVTLLMLVSVSAFSQTVPQLINLQGRLAKPDGTPLPDAANQKLIFRLFDAVSGGALLWSQSNSNITVRNGAFAVLLNVATGYATGHSFNEVFTGKSIFLEIQVGGDPPLSPRQQVVSNAYAFTATLALTVPTNSITNANIVSLDFSKLTNVPANVSGWGLTGNAATNPATNFLGTTDNQPLSLRVNNQRVLRIEYHTNNANETGVNVLGGFSLNSVNADVTGATIFGGGNFTGADRPNFVYDEFGTVSGGALNKAGSDNASFVDGGFAFVGGGYGNQASGERSVVGGGSVNTASGNMATVAGGSANQAHGNEATVGGGFSNSAFGDYATVAGGQRGAAQGVYSTVPGGDSNLALGDYSFAAGRMALANHAGAFVWADSANASFSSTLADQFSIRAAGGVRIVSDRDVNSAATSGALAIISSAGTSSVVIDQNEIEHIGSGDFLINFDNVSNTNLNNGTLLVTTGGRVGIGDGSPGFKLELPNIASDTGGRGRANAWVTYSSGRWKHNVTAIENPLDKLLQMRGVMFDWNAENGGGHDIGFVAEEVGKVIPELVTWEDDSAFASGMKYDRVTALTVEAIKAQQKQIDALKTKVETLEAQNAELKKQNAEIAEMKKQLAALLAARQRDAKK